MAAFFNIHARRARTMRVRPHVPPVEALTPSNAASYHLARPRLVAQWRVGPDNRIARIWLSEESAALKNPPD
jgi:hypothetical protein